MKASSNLHQNPLLSVYILVYNIFCCLLLPFVSFFFFFLQGSNVFSNILPIQLLFILLCLFIAGSSCLKVLISFLITQVTIISYLSLTRKRNTCLFHVLDFYDQLNRWGRHVHLTAPVMPD